MVSGLFTEVTGICVNTDDNTADIKAPLNMLSMLLDVLHSVLKYVSEVVRKALQVSGCPIWCPKIYVWDMVRKSLQVNGCSTECPKIRVGCGAHSCTCLYRLHFCQFF